MDADYSDSDMSRLTTMLTNIGAEFERSYAPDGVRLIEIGNVEFHFEAAGRLIGVVVRMANAPSGAP